MRRILALVLSLAVLLVGANCMAENVNFSEGVTSPIKLADGLFVGEDGDLQPGWYSATPSSEGTSKLTIVDVESFDRPVIVASYSWWPEGTSLLSDCDDDPEQYVFPLWEGCFILAGYFCGLEFDKANGELSWERIDDAPAIGLEYVAPLGETEYSAPDNSSHKPEVELFSESNGLGEEILFRGIPWLVSINEAAEMLGLDGRLYDEEQLFSWGPHYSRVSADNAGFEYSARGVGNTFFVAGYSVNEVYLYAIYGHTENQINRNADASEFYKATYWFDVDGDGTVMYEELFTKLCNLYGSPSEVHEEADKAYSVWLGLDNTGVILDKSRLYTYRDSISLSYGRTDADSLITNFKFAAANENKANTENEYDGLK